MSLNNIQLSPQLLADLYGRFLVESPGSVATVSSRASAVPDQAPIEEPVAPAWRYLGENKKHILLVVHADGVPFVDDASLHFLTSILTACKLSLADTAVLNLANSPARGYKEVQSHFKPAYTILFGISPEQFEMPLSFPEFQVQPFNHCVYLHTPALDALESDKLLKSKLWVCLKKMFAI
jgi:hypothetical protein